MGSPDTPHDAARHSRSSITEHQKQAIILIVLSAVIYIACQFDATLNLFLPEIDEEVDEGPKPDTHVAMIALLGERNSGTRWTTECVFVTRVGRSCMPYFQSHVSHESLFAFHPLFWFDSQPLDRMLQPLDWGMICVLSLYLFGFLSLLKLLTHFGLAHPYTILDSHETDSIQTLVPISCPVSISAWDTRHYAIPQPLRLA